MNVIRAKQIVESPEEISVHHFGTPVWIQHVDEKMETARIYPLAETEDERTVSIAELEEF